MCCRFCFAWDQISFCLDWLCRLWVPLVLSVHCRASCFKCGLCGDWAFGLWNSDRCRWKSNLFFCLVSGFSSLFGIAHIVRSNFDFAVFISASKWVSWVKSYWRNWTEDKMHRESDTDRVIRDFLSIICGKDRCRPGSLSQKFLLSTFVLFGFILGQVTSAKKRRERQLMVMTCYGRWQPWGLKTILSHSRYTWLGTER